MIPKNNLPRQEPMRFQSFDHTVRDICAYLGDDTAKTLYVKVSRFLRLAVEELNLYLFVKNVKSVFLTVGDNMTIDLPDDLQTLSKVAVCCKDGRLRFIGQDNHLCPPKDQPLFECCDCSKGVPPEKIDDDVAVKEPGTCCAACTFHNVDGYSGSHFSRLFGELPFAYAGRYLYGYKPQMFRNGTYMFDEANHRLVLGNGCDVRPGSEILVEYNAALDSDDYDLIPKKAVVTLMYKVAHSVKMAKNPNAAQLEFQMFKRHYRQLKKTYQTYTLEDLVGAIRGTYRSSPKR